MYKAILRKLTSSIPTTSIQSRFDLHLFAHIVAFALRLPVGNLANSGASFQLLVRIQPRERLLSALVKDCKRLAPYLLRLRAGSFLHCSELASQAEGAPDEPGSGKLHALTTSVPAAETLEFFNGFGGFADDGREYVTILRDGQCTPAPWINIITNPAFGFQVSAEGAGYT